MEGARTSAAPSVLFLDKVFLKRVPDPLRGVELFNLRLARDLADLGLPLTLVAERSWEPSLRGFLGTRPVDLRLVRRHVVNPSTLLTAALALRGARVDRLLLGNVGNGILPLVRHLHRRGVFGRAVLIAHREAAPRFVSSLRAIPCTAVCVNGQIAQPFRTAGFERVAVDYGIFDADRFHPRAAPRTDGAIRFVVLGALDNAWKGADTAIAAFQSLPAALRARCELHLASYLTPPAPPAPGIHAHGWLPATGIPDLLRDMDVMICPSRDEVVMRETFSQAIVQGMLTGLPVLASGLPILREKLDAGGGAIFDSVPALAALMERLAADASLRARWGAEGRATALARYVWDTPRFVARYLQSA